MDETTDLLKALYPALEEALDLHDVPNGTWVELKLNFCRRGSAIDVHSMSLVPLTPDAGSIAPGPKPDASVTALGSAASTS